MKSAEDSNDFLYGINPAFEVVRAGRRRLIRAHILPQLKAQPRTKKLLALLAERGVPVAESDRKAIFTLCQSTEHQGIVLEASAYPCVPLDDMLGEKRLLLLDNVEDPQNVGAILRSAEFFGWTSVLLSAKGVPGIYPSVAKASAGACEHLKICRDCSAVAAVKKLRELDWTVVALDNNGREDLTAVAPLPFDRLLLVIGGEHLSVGQFILNQSHHVVAIPRRGQVQSLNASAAAAIALFAFGGSNA